MMNARATGGSLVACALAIGLTAACGETTDGTQAGTDGGITIAPGTDAAAIDGTVVGSGAVPDAGAEGAAVTDAGALDAADADAGPGGAVLVFEKTNGAWGAMPVQTLTAKDGVQTTAFGLSLAISGDVAIFGSGGAWQGASSVYIESYEPVP